MNSFKIRTLLILKPLKNKYDKSKSPSLSLQRKEIYTRY